MMTMILGLSAVVAGVPSSLLFFGPQDASVEQQTWKAQTDSEWSSM